MVWHAPPDRSGGATRPLPGISTTNSPTGWEHGDPRRAGVTRPDATATSGRVRRLGRRALIATLALAGIALVVVVLVAFPAPLFPHHRQLGGVSVRSDREIGDDVERAVAEARRRLEAARGESGLPKVRVFIAHSPRRYGLFCAIARRRPDTQGLAFSRLGNVIPSIDGIGQVRARTGGEPAHSRLEATLATALAHELAHLDLERAPARPAPWPLAAWKSEGWADDTANLAPARADPGYDLRRRALLLLDDAWWGTPRRPSDRRHFRWHVLIEYLATVQGLTLEEISDPSVTEEAAWRELRGWL